MHQSTTVSITSRRNLLCLLLILSSLISATTAKRKAQASASESGTSSAPSTGIPRRERNLDFLDADTLAYYLGVDPQTATRTTDSTPSSSQHNHNVAVMFYAQWDRNSHALAPYWDHIATLMRAGTKRSNLIMGLFDCESNELHINLCAAAGITHYPTLMYISASRKFPHKPTLKGGKLPHTSMFPGDWRYDGSIFDWLKVMQGMSKWSNLWTPKDLRGWWQRLVSPEKRDMLPVGPPVPTAATSSTGSSTGSSSSSTSFSSSSSSTTPPADWQKEKQQLEELSLRSSQLLDTTLFPKTEPTTNTSDVYQYLDMKNGWTSPNSIDMVIRTCAMEIALDYCTRVTTHKTDDLIESITLPSGEIDTGNMAAEDLEKQLKDMVNTAEPYCALVETCILTDFEGFQCRPSTCPFQNEVACRYLSSCFEQSIQKEYAKVMGLSLINSSSSAGSDISAEGTATATEETAPKRKRGWF